MAIFHFSRKTEKIDRPIFLYRRIRVALRFFRLPVMSDDIIGIFPLCILKFTWAGYANDVIGHDREPEKS